MAGFNRCFKRHIRGDERMTWTDAVIESIGDVFNGTIALIDEITEWFMDGI